MKMHKYTFLLLHYFETNCEKKNIRPVLEMEINKKEERCGLFLGDWGYWNVFNSSSYVGSVSRKLQVQDKCVRKVEKIPRKTYNARRLFATETAHQVITPGMLARIDGLIQKNIRVTVEETCIWFDINNDSLHAVIEDHLQSQRIPRSEFRID